MDSRDVHELEIAYARARNGPAFALRQIINLGEGATERKGGSFEFWESDK